MSGGSDWGGRIPGHVPPGAAGDGSGSGWFFPLTRGWAAGALVYVVAGFLVTRALVETLATDERLDSFGWRLALLHLPAVLVTVLTVLAAARALPDRHRESRLLHLLGTLAVPVAGLAYGYVVAWDVVGTEGLLMPAVAMVTGAAVGLAVDRLLEDGDTDAAPSSTYTRSYDWRDQGATAMEYLGVVLLVVALVGALAMAGVGGRIGDRIRCAISSLTGTAAAARRGRRHRAAQDRRRLRTQALPDIQRLRHGGRQGQDRLVRVG